MIRKRAQRRAADQMTALYATSRGVILIVRHAEIFPLQVLDYLWPAKPARCDEGG